MPRLDGFSSIGGPSLSGLTRLRADTLDVRSRATFQCPITGPTGSFNYLRANTLYAPTGTIGSLSVGKIYGPTGSFDYLYAGNGTINNLTTSMFIGSTGSFTTLHVDTFTVDTFQSLANTSVIGTIIGTDLNLSGNATIGKNLSVSGTSAFSNTITQSAGNFTTQNYIGAKGIIPTNTFGDANVSFSIGADANRLFIDGITSGTTANEAKVIFRTATSGGASATALTLDGSQNATFTNALSVSGNTALANVSITGTCNVSSNILIGNSSTQSANTELLRFNMDGSRNWAFEQFANTASTGLRLRPLVDGKTFYFANSARVNQWAVGYNNNIVHFANTDMANVSISGVLSVSGNTAMANTTITGALSVSGNTSLANVSITGTQHIGSVSISSGTGSPEGVVVAVVGSLFLRTDHQDSFYVKQTGSANTGWQAK